LHSHIKKTTINQIHPVYRFKDFLKERFPYQVRKLPIHTYLGCPHRDSGSAGGCIYCYEPAFSTLRPDLPDVNTQISNWIERSRKRGYEGKFIAYFQTGTNTYAETALLKKWWNIVFDYPDDIAGLAIGTRPDCLQDSAIELLADFSKRLMVWLELGLQSANDETLRLINRGHDYNCFRDAVTRVRAYGSILICAHVIMGLPDETVDDMLYTIREINRLKLEGIKIHHLQVVKHTVLQNWFENSRVKLFDEYEYIDLMSHLLPHLDNSICVHRLIGDIQDDLLIAPRWTLPKTQVIQLIEKRLRDMNTFQGKAYTSND